MSRARKIPWPPKVEPVKRTKGNRQVNSDGQPTTVRLVRFAPDTALHASIDNESCDCGREQIEQLGAIPWNPLGASSGEGTEAQRYRGWLSRIATASADVPYLRELALMGLEGRDPDALDSVKVGGEGREPQP